MFSKLSYNAQSQLCFCLHGIEMISGRNCRRSAGLADDILPDAMRRRRRRCKDRRASGAIYRRLQRLYERVRCARLPLTDVFIQDTAALPAPSQKLDRPIQEVTTPSMIYHPIMLQCLHLLPGGQVDILRRRLLRCQGQSH